MVYSGILKVLDLREKLSEIKDAQCWVSETSFELLFWVTPGTIGIMAEIRMRRSGLWLCRKHEVVSWGTITRRRLLWGSLVATAWTSCAFELPVCAWDFANSPSSTEAHLSELQVVVAGSQLGSQSAPQIAQVAQPWQGPADQTGVGGRGLAPHKVFDSSSLPPFLSCHLKDFLWKAWASLGT